MTFTKQTIEALKNTNTCGYAALAAAAGEAAAAKASVRELATSIRAVCALTCGQAALAAGLKEAKAGANAVAVAAAMADKAEEVARKARDKARIKAAADAEAKLAKAEAAVAAKRLALHGTPKEQAAAALAVAKEEHDRALAELDKASVREVDASNALKKAQKAYDDAAAAEQAAAAAAAPAEQAAAEVTAKVS